MSRVSDTVVVTAPARLHFGLLDLRGDLGRRFGGLGAALETPALELEARRAPQLRAEGEEAARVLEFAERYRAREPAAGGAVLRVRRAIPAHSGLGSGTQLALATARALAALHGGRSDAGSLAAAVGRARRSAIGTWLFEGGGFVLEGGRRDGDDGPGPLLLKRPMPRAWRCLLVIPAVASGLSGNVEEQAFRDLPRPAAVLVERIAHRVLLGVLPALVEEDLAAFGRHVTELQRLVGAMFAPAQGDRFASREASALIEDLLKLGAAGAGQSSWGPAVFGLFPGEAEAAAAARRLEGRGSLIVSAFDNVGARCRDE